MKEILAIDHLTRACKRAHLSEVAEPQRLKCSLQDQPLVLIAIEIDHFKQVNNHRGHATGDTPLKAVAITCKGPLRTNTTLARLGREEFVVLLSSADMAAAVGLAERLRKAIGAVSLYDARRLRTSTASSTVLSRQTHQ